MSWSEVYKVNSDIQGEPLNFLNYLNDLKLNELDSYVLYDGNIRIWEELYLNSLYLFSNRGIREVVYAAFSETDIDNLFDKSTKLGEQLNAFYRTDIFSLGNADNVVKGMTIEYYNSLEQKFKDGYDRYVTREQEKTTIGAWFNSAFSLNNDDLESLTTIDEILANTEATNVILNNSNAIVALTMCESSMDAVVASSNAMDLLGQYILKVTVEPVVIRAILKNNVIRDAIINSSEAMTQIATNEKSIIEIFSDLEATKTLVGNQESVNKILTNNIAVERIIPVLLEMKTNLTNSLNYINIIYTNIVLGRNTLVSLPYAGDIFPIVLNITNNYNEMVNVHDKIKEEIEEKIKIADTILESSVAMNVLANNAIIVNKAGDRTNILSNILSKTASLNAFMKNTNAIKILIGKSTAINMIVNNSTAFGAMITTSGNVSVIANNSTAMSAIATNATAIGTVANNDYAISAFVKSTTAMNAIVSSTTAMNRIANTPLALNRMVKSDIAKSVLVGKNSVLQNYKANIYNTITGSSAYFKVITNFTNSDSAPAQVINSTYVGITYCYGYNSATSKYAIVYHGYNTNIEAGRGDGAKDENKRFITLGGTKYVESGDGYFTFAIYQAI
ncbi:phage tail protein [Clostridioides sp. ES-S-0001-02]|uniref:phage tail protein n=1 Tax=Clostridioides sp. ES-S-0001-02 TaxID=2770770 RepID=UPI001D101D2D|nr:phage tail protein [Clostridioides sp. ES-S-0001-02]